MQYRWILTALCLCLNILASAPPAGAQSTNDWLAHDMRRPRPPVVKPAPQRLPVPPPADAIVLFDGTNLSNWRDPEAGSTKWIVRNGCMESTPKSGYVVSRSGWISDRSICYLASGRPVLAQDTGFGAFVPTGEGLVPFATMDDLLDGIQQLNADYTAHAVAARRLAEEHFDSDIVLSRLLSRLQL